MKQLLIGLALLVSTPVMAIEPPIKTEEYKLILDSKIGKSGLLVKQMLKSQCVDYTAESRYYPDTNKVSSVFYCDLNKFRINKNKKKGVERLLEPFEISERIYGSDSDKIKEFLLKEKDNEVVTATAMFVFNYPRDNRIKSVEYSIAEVNIVMQDKKYISTRGVDRALTMHMYENHLFWNDTINKLVKELK